MTKQQKPKKSSTGKSNKVSLRRWFSHGSGGHITVMIFITLLGVGFFIYAASNGTLEKYYYLIILLVLALLVQIILFIRIRRQS